MTTRTFPCYNFIKYEGQDAIDEFDMLDGHDLEDPDIEFHFMVRVKIKGANCIRQNTMWSISKCEKDSYIMKFDEDGNLINPIVDNGKIQYIDEFITTMTDIDFYDFRQFYSVDDYEVLTLWKSRADYLPKEMILTILDYYGYKTSLKMKKDDHDWSPSIESKYAESKQFVNGIYGCSVTKIVSDDISYSESGWGKTPLNEEGFKQKIWATDEEKTFLAYQQGVWVTSWAKHNLFKILLQIDKGWRSLNKAKVLYGDTDSLFIQADFDMGIVERYNEEVKRLEEGVAARLGFDPELYTPKTKKGVEKRLGVFTPEDDCGWYGKFLGAKRYVTWDGEDEIECTIAGLPKQCGVDKIKKEFASGKYKTPLDVFTNGLKWSTTESGKKTRYYLDNQEPTKWIDDDGNIFYCTDQFGAALVPTTFDLSLSSEYEMLLSLIANDGVIPFDDARFTDVSELFLDI